MKIRDIEEASQLAGKRDAMIKWAKKLKDEDLDPVLVVQNINSIRYYISKVSTTDLEPEFLRQLMVVVMDWYEVTLEEIETKLRAMDVDLTGPEA